MYVVIDNKKRLFRITLWLETLEIGLYAWLFCSIFLYIQQNIDVSERAFISVVATTTTLTAWHLLRKRGTYVFIEKNISWVWLIPLIVEGTAGFVIVSNPFFAAVLDAIVCGIAWVISNQVVQDYVNRLFKGKARTLLSAVSMTYKTGASTVGAAIAMVQGDIEPGYYQWIIISLVSASCIISCGQITLFKRYLNTNH